MNCQAAVAWCFTSSELKRFRASGEYRVAAADSFPTLQKIRRSPTMNGQAAVVWCFTSSELKRFRASGEYRVAAADSDRIHSQV